MEEIERIKENLRESIHNRKALLLFTGDKGSTLLINIIRGMNIHAVFIDTGFHFDEILAYRETLTDKIEIIKNHSAAPDSSVHMPDFCNRMKVELLTEYLSRHQGECLIVPFLDEDKKYGVEDSYLNGLKDVKIIRPLANVNERDVWIMINESNMPYSSIYNKGYKVVDCKCCTTRTGRKKPVKERSDIAFDKETVEKLKSLGYM